MGTKPRIEPRRSLNEASDYQLSYAAQYLSYASLYRATPNPTELCTLHCTFLSYYAFSELRCTVSELRLTLPSYAPPNWAVYAAPFWATMHSLSYAAPYLSYASLYRATPHPTELCALHLSELLCILWATLHRIWATPHSTELRPIQLSYVRCTFLSYYAFSELRCTVSELRLTLPSYAPPNWALYAALFWATIHSLSYPAP
jgi:hypothetical protein